MMRSLFSAITGLRNHQTRMDVIGNNISNVNTVGYKSSRVVFQDIYSQTLKPASGSNGTTYGGTNAQQIGLGSSLANIDVQHTRSASQYTGGTMDLSIEGDGYFTVGSPGDYSYTRAGNFYTDTDNYLVTANGDYVMGFQLDPTTHNPVTPMALERIKLDPAIYYDVTIDESGTVNALTKVGNTKSILGRIAMATFSNENGLQKAGQNTYTSTVNSGNAVYSLAGSAGAGKIKPGSLEMSNVDLANEFSDMIVTQRGFQANSRVITTTDSMLEELVNLKR